ALLLRRGPDLLKTWPGLRVLLPALGLVLIATALDVPREPPDATSKYVRYQLTQLAALVLVACLVRRVSDMRIVLGVGLALVVASAAVAVWQVQDSINAPYTAPLGNGLNPSERASLSDGALRVVGLS